MLTDTEVRCTKSDPTRELRLADGEGLFLAILPSGKRYWRWDYSFEGRRKQLSFGKYPVVTVKKAREKKLAAQQLLDDGLDPSVERRRDKRTSSEESFKAVADEWLVVQKGTLGLSTYLAKKARVETFLLPALGARRVRDIKPPDVLPLLQAIERQSKIDTAHRVRAIASEIFRHAIITGRGETDPAACLGDALRPIRAKHHPSLIDPIEVGKLLTAIDHTDGSPYIVAAMRLTPMFFLRPFELRKARWVEFDLDNAIWRIPAARMKPTADRIDHLVPLATQAVAILRDLKTIAGDHAFVFPSLKYVSRPISDATLSTVLRRLGYSRQQQSVHGFRTLASTHLRELGFESDLVELQLSHKIGTPVRAAYDRAARVPERVHMMQVWADHLDELKTGRVVALRPRVGAMPLAAVPAVGGVQ